jgi:hypothetical protein
MASGAFKIGREDEGGNVYIFYWEMDGRLNSQHV